MSVNISVKIARMLRELGVPCNVRGYAYLKTAIEYVYENSEAIHRITKELYPAVAKLYNTTASRVERCIRLAVELCFDNSSTEVLRYFFGNQISYHKGKVTNSAFIACLVEHIHLEEMTDSNGKSSELD